MNDLSVHFEGVSKTYPHFTLDDISLELPTGTIMGLIGRTAPASPRPSAF